MKILLITKYMKEKQERKQTIGFAHIQGQDLLFHRFYKFDEYPYYSGQDNNCSFLIS